MLATKIQKTIVLLGIIAFIAVGILGIGSFGMPAGANGQMSDCPFMGVAAVCKMNSFEHIGAWQSMFATIPFKEISTLVLLLLAGFSVFLWRDFWNTKWIQFASGYSWHFRGRAFVTRNELQEALSSGILHPKIF